MPQPTNVIPIKPNGADSPKLPRTRPHVGLMMKYAEDIVSGKIVAGRHVILACQRHLDDLERAEQRNPDFPYYWDPKAAERVCVFAELLPHVKGDWAKRKELLRLEPWECFTLGVPFGWMREDGTRRFREIYDEIPRKNGKSIIGAVIGNYMFMFDKEFGAEVYSGATSEKQAWEVFGPARLMIVRSPDICEEAGIEIGAKHMVKTEDRSKFQPLIGNPGDGANVSCAIIDEFHEHQTSNQYDTMVTGTGARRQPMIAVITTSGSSLAGPCYEKHIQAKKVLEGVLQNDELFVMIYSIDENDDWSDPAALKKANPNYGVSVSAEYLLSQQRQAVQSAEYQNRFKTKHLNVWCSAKIAWMNMQHWLACEDRALREVDFKGEECYEIIDLASRNDICVLMKLFMRLIDGEKHYYAFGKYYLPESAVEEPGPNQSSYRSWRDAGPLTVTDGSEIDFDFIGEEVIEDSRAFKVTEVVYDPWHAVHLAQQLTKQGAKCVEYRQTVQTMSLPMKELMSAVKSGRFHHDGNPVLTWMMSNVVAKEDAKENIYPRKEKNEFKIDGVIAIIMGLGRATVDTRTPDKKYQMIIL